MAEMAATDIEQKLEQARLAEHTERYEDMAASMKSVVESSGKDLQGSTRNLLSVAYKNVVGTKRSAWRLLSSLEAKESNKELIIEYKKKIETDLRAVCDEVLVCKHGAFMPYCFICATIHLFVALQQRACIMTAFFEVCWY